MNLTRKMIGGSPIRAIAVDSFLFMPPLNALDGLSAKLVKQSFFIAHSTTYGDTGNVLDVNIKHSLEGLDLVTCLFSFLQKCYMLHNSLSLLDIKLKRTTVNFYVKGNDFPRARFSMRYI